MKGLKNLVTMILDQAKTGREVKGTKVTIVPDNKTFMVSDIDQTEGTVTVIEDVPKDAPEMWAPEVIVLTAKNAHIAHYGFNPNPKPIPISTIIRDQQTGKCTLRIDGASDTDDDYTDISCGQIDVKEVLCGTPGFVYLLCGNANGGTDLVAYNVQMDEFNVIEYDFMEPGADVEVKAFVVDGKVGYVQMLTFATITVVDANGKPSLTQRTLQKNCLLSLNNGYSNKIDDGASNELPIIDAMSVVKQADRSILVLSVTRELDVDGVVVNKTTPNLVVCENCADEYVPLGVYKVKDIEAQVFLGGALNKAPVITVKDKGQVIITTLSNGITTVVDDAEVVSALNGYNYFDGLYPDSDGNVTWYYSNKNRDEVCFVSRKTDRGILFELVD